AMNIASRTAKADLLFFLSPNVEVAPDTVKTLADTLESDESAVAVCPLLQHGDGSPALRAGKLPTREILESVAQGGKYPVAAIGSEQESAAVEYASLDALMARKQFVRGMNYFDERFGHYWPEADLAGQIRRVGKKIKVY